MLNIFKRKETPKLKSIEDDLSDKLQGRINDYVINTLPNINLDKLIKLPWGDNYYNFYMVIEDKELYYAISSIHNRQCTHFPDCVDEKRKILFRINFANLDCLNVLGNRAYILFYVRLNKLDLV